MSSRPLHNNAAVAPEVLVADIGGTNARYALANFDHEGGVLLSKQQSTPCIDYESLEHSLVAYLDAIDQTPPVHACLSVAGPVTGDQVDLTNRLWRFSQQHIRQVFGFESLHVINDFAALAHGIHLLDRSALVTLNTGSAPLQAATRVVMGPGTGFGLSCLVANPATHDNCLANPWLVISGEGGHAGFAPQGAEEIELLRLLHAQHGRVARETLLSGRGLENLYQVMGQRRDRSEPALDAAEITRLGTQSERTMAHDCLDRFCNILGSVAGDIALSFGAKGGVYLGGGILPRIQGSLLRSEFLNRFMSKSPMNHYLNEIPIHLVVSNDASLTGAAVWHRQQQPSAKTKGE